MITFFENRKITFVIVLIFLCGIAQAQITSPFNSNAEGWTTPNDADGTITYSATGGNPGGFVFGSPFVFVTGSGTIYIPFDFVAPGTYTGNRSSYYNGTLRYDVQQSTTGAPNQNPEVTIIDATGVALYYFPATSNQPPAGTWATYSVTMNNALGFWKTTNSATGAAATEAQILSVLTSLNTLSIRGLYRDANVTSRLDNVTFYPPIIVTTQPVSRVVCDGINTSLNTAATGNASITYQWQVQGSGPLFLWSDVANGGGYSTATTASLSVNTTGNFGAGTYRCRISGTSVNDAFTNVVSITVNALPAAPTTTGNASCVAASLVLTATGGSAGQYRWYTAPTGGIAIAGQTNSTYTTPLLSLTTTYYVSINNGTCESNRTPVIATITTTPSAPGATGNSSCGSAAITLNATGGAAGQYRWYTVATGGTAIAGQTNSAYTTPTINATTTYYVSINNGACEGPRTPIVATIITLPTPPTAIGNASCGAAAIILNASGGTAGQYRWYTLVTGGTAIAGETNSIYTTPVLSITTTYYVSINNGTCESTRTPVFATINSIPTAPTTTGNSLCGPASFSLNAVGGSAGQYRWYTQATGGSALAGETNSSYITPIISTTTTYYVSINNGVCESLRTSVIATILTTGCNSVPPTITPATLEAVVEGKVTKDLVPLINAPGILDVSSIKIKTQPSSGAFAEVVNGVLTIDYKGKPFSGLETLTIEACDIGNLCTSQIFTIEVAGDIFVYNAISPNSDTKNDFFNIKYIDAFSKKGNTVSIYNRWGSKVFEANNYNNTSTVFKGLNDNGNELPSGTYFYKISYDKGISTGYLELKR